MDSKKIRLRTLITSLSTGAVMLTALLLLGALTLFQKTNIEDSIVQNNIAYARKLADTTDRYLTIAQSELRWSAGQIKGLSNPQQLRSEADRLRLQSGFFNSVVVVNRDRVVKATSPESLNLVGTRLASDASMLAITSQKPFISQPFISATGNYVVFLSQPLFSADGRYLGYIGGTIYLKKHSMLSDILSQHFYSGGSDIQIVNNNGMIIFNHKPELVGTRETFSPSVSTQLQSNGSGKLILHNNGKAYQAGYASLNKTDWNIFVSGDENAVNAILFATVKKSIGFILAIVALIGGLMIFLGTRVAAPLETLANLMRDDNGKDDKTPSLEAVPVWYYEAYQLKDAVQERLRLAREQVTELTDEAMTDPLTGTYNRRGFNWLYNKFAPGTPMSVIAIDVDHFKNVNDRHGHDAGDAVLVMLARELQKTCRKDDILSRFGGEEFILLLPGLGIHDAAAMAERIRQMIGSALFPFAGHITVSAGVASLSDNEGDIQVLLRRADEALYEAKGAGRNKVVIATQNGFERYDQQ